MAEFDNPTALVSARPRRAREGYRKLDAYSPFPIEELTDALHLHKNKLPLIVLIGGILGGLTGYMLQYYVTVIYFPINIGRPPLHSWPSYIIITFELTILFAAISAVLGLLALCGCRCRIIRRSMCRDSRWPRAIASFCVSKPRDPLFDHDKTSEFLETLEPRRYPKLRINLKPRINLGDS